MGFDKNLIGSALTNEPPSARSTCTHSPEAHRTRRLPLQSRLRPSHSKSDYDNAVADMDKARKLIDPQLIHLIQPTCARSISRAASPTTTPACTTRQSSFSTKPVAVVLSPSDYPATYYHRGLSHYRKGSYRRAIADFDQGSSTSHRTTPMPLTIGNSPTKSCPNSDVHIDIGYGKMPYPLCKAR